MGPQDIKILALSFLGVATLVTFAAIFPIYRMPDGAYERHFIWNAPTMPVGHGYDLLKPADIERLSKDPVQKDIIDRMREMPRSIPIRPIFIGPRSGPGRNPLGYIAMLSVIGWFVFAGSKWMNR